MSKRHQSSRRRSYGRRQHEIRGAARAPPRTRPAGGQLGRSRRRDAGRPARLPRSARAAPPLRLRGLMAVYQGARKRGLELPRPTLDLDLPFAGRRGQAASGLVREGRPTRVGTVLAGIVVAFVLAFLSLSQSVRTAATSYDIVRLGSEYERLDALRARSSIEPRPARSRTRDPQAGPRRRPRPTRRAPHHSGPLATIGVARDPRSN